MILDEIRVAKKPTPRGTEYFIVVKEQGSEDETISGAYTYAGKAESAVWRTAFERCGRLNRPQLVVTQTGAFVVSVGEYPQERSQRMRVLMK